MSVTEPIPDAELVRAYVRGDERAAGVLVGRHAAAIGRYLYSSGADRGEIEDLVQETLWRAFRRIQSWRGTAAFRSWLFTIAGNLLKDQARKRRGRVIVSLEDNDVVDRADPASDLLARDMAERLREGIGRLPRLQRDVFLLRTQEGMEYADIAVALGTTPGAARVHYHHAVKRLKDTLS